MGLGVAGVTLEWEGEHLNFPVSPESCVGDDNGQQGNQKE